MNAKDLKRQLATASWNWDFFKFCEVTGTRPDMKDPHANEMWGAFQNLCKSINKFDSETLQTILDASRQ